MTENSTKDRWKWKVLEVRDLTELIDDEGNYFKILTERHYGGYLPKFPNTLELEIGNKSQVFSRVVLGLCGHPFIAAPKNDTFSSQTFPTGFIPLVKEGLYLRFPPDGDTPEYPYPYPYGHEIQEPTFWQRVMKRLRPHRYR